MIDTGSIIEAVCYTLEKIGGKATKMKILKLIFLADKYHLVNYGRTVTGDEYFAMKDGPVGSTVKDVLEFNDISLSDDEYELAAQYFNIDSDNKTISIKQAIPSSELKSLSETDIEAMDHAVNNFGHLEAWQLRDLTHKYPEWKQYEDMFSKKAIKRERIRVDEMFSIIPEDHISVSEEHMEESKKYRQGYFD